MRLVLPIAAVLAMVGCGFSKAIQEANAWREEAKKLQVERDQARKGFVVCTRAYDRARSEALESSALLRSCQSGVRAL